MAECSFIDCRLQDDGVAVLTLDNPPLNLTTLATLDKLISTCRGIAGDEKVRAVVVVGAGEKAFCAGSDINEFPHVRHDVVECKLARENEAFAALEQLPTPVIADSTAWRSAAEPRSRSPAISASWTRRRVLAFPR